MSHQTQSINRARDQAHRQVRNLTGFSNGIGRVVFQSSVGAEKRHGTGLIDGTIADSSFLGDQVTYDVATATSGRFLVKERNGGDGRMRKPGSQVSLSWRQDAAVLLESGV